MNVVRLRTHRFVELPDGSLMYDSDLPPEDTARWTAKRKALVARAVSIKLIGRDEALKLYGLSDEELDCWITMHETYGAKGLQATKRMGGSRSESVE